MVTTTATAIRRGAMAAPGAVHQRFLARTRPATGPRLGSALGDLTGTEAAHRESHRLRAGTG